MRFLILGFVAAIAAAGLLPTAAAYTCVAPVCVSAAPPSGQLWCADPWSGGGAGAGASAASGTTYLSGSLYYFCLNFSNYGENGNRIVGYSAGGAVAGRPMGTFGGMAWESYYGSSGAGPYYRVDCWVYYYTDSNFHPAACLSEPISSSTDQNVRNIFRYDASVNPDCPDPGYSGSAIVRACLAGNLGTALVGFTGCNNSGATQATVAGDAFSSKEAGFAACLARSALRGV